MDEDEWQGLETAKRGTALHLAGVPDREGSEPNLYEAQDWSSLPQGVTDKLLLLPDNWEQRHPFEE